jgi:hypothetical protein
VLAVSTIGSVIGYALLIGVENTKARLFAVCLVAFSTYPNIVLMLSWVAMNFVGYTSRYSGINSPDLISLPN